MNVRLAIKNKEVRPESWVYLKNRLIQKRLKQKVNKDGAKKYKDYGDELAINRKQIAHIIAILAERGIDAALPEFVEYNNDVEQCKAEAKAELGM